MSESTSESNAIDDYDQQFQNFLLSSGYIDAGDYAANLTLTARNQIIRKDGEFYIPTAVVDLPYITSGNWSTEEALFSPIGDRALRQQLAMPTGSSLVMFRQYDTVPEAIVRPVLSKLRDTLSVFDFLTAEQREDAFMRRASVDTGPRFQMALDFAKHGKLIVQPGCVFATSQEIIARYATRLEGGGRGMVMYPFDKRNIPNTQLRTLGDGTLYKTVKTRRKYRGSASDPQDDPISAVLNIQHQNFNIGHLNVHISYDETRIYSEPNYLGDDWDTAIFVGCRLHFKIKDSAATGCARVANIYYDVTRGKGLPELKGWDGIRHPVDNQFGGDGATIEDVVTWGGRWGLVILGASPKEGLISYGRDYTVRLTTTLVSQPLNGDTLTYGDQVFTFVNEPPALGQVQIGATTTETAQRLVEAATIVSDSQLPVPKFRTALFLANANEILALEREAGTNSFQNTFSASASSSARIVLSGNTPNVTADPAPYYDEELGTTVPDTRGSYGFSDFAALNNQFFGSNHPTATARVTIRSDKNWILEGLSAGSVYIDGLAGNSSRKLQGHRFFNNRFDGKYDPFNLRLGRTHRDEFFGNHWDGTATTGYKNPDGTNVGQSARNFKYGPTTKIPGITQRTRLYSMDSIPWADYFTWESGDGSALDRNGGLIATGSVQIERAGNLLMNSYYSTTGTSEIVANCGTNGYIVQRYRSGGAALTLASIRYGAATGVLEVNSRYELVQSGNLDPSSTNGSWIRWRLGSQSMMRHTADEFIIYSNFRATTTGKNLGTASVPWENGYIKNAWTVTSDASRKTAVRPLNEQELRVGSRLAREPGVFQWLASIEEKGAEKARLHHGMTVQRAGQIMVEEGLDPAAYGFYCHDEWLDEWDQEPDTEQPSGQLDEEGNPLMHVVPGARVLVRAAGSLFGFREGPLHMLLIRALAHERDMDAHRLDLLESRLAAIEKKF
ncbi:tail fiber domain-containing protein [Pseudomonas cremoricolorata]|uniref:tail fiber domain-containing protein n=1 Tax=Pseudomonas cremoricolorata TaxID=157783 RepID=UPI0004038CBC|nr:hypothetical protein [Pseudomonas cremoricolorata]